MQNWVAISLIAGLLVVVCGVFVWVTIRLTRTVPVAKKSPQEISKEAVVDDVGQIFNDEFREELRNRGRRHFEKIISENAMFLQQDLRLTTSQINEYMKQEITKTLQEAFVKYEESISDAKQEALNSIHKTKDALENQRLQLGDELEREIADQKQRRLGRFDDNMAEIINYYVLEAIGSQISLDDQLEYILAELERNKQAIIEDIRVGA